jgi:hypothetical protein
MKRTTNTEWRPRAGDPWIRVTRGFRQLPLHGQFIEHRPKTENGTKDPVWLENWWKVAGKDPKADWQLEELKRDDSTFVWMRLPTTIVIPIPQ